MNYEIFDAHFHIIYNKFPLVPNNEYTPSPFTMDDYLFATRQLKICGGAIVSGSFQGYDQTYLLSALKQFGSDFVGVTQLPHTVSDQEIIRLNQNGVRALRFNFKRGGSENLKYLYEMARRVHDLVSWHVELYVDSKQLSEMYNILIDLPAVSIDHIGLTKSGFNTLLKLVEQGIKVKASGFGRVDFEVSQALQEINKVNPKALMFGTDLPSTRAKRPFMLNDIRLIIQSLNEESAQRVLSRNALEFYRIK